MINVTDDLVWEVQDQVQRVSQMVGWLVRRAGGDPEVIGRLPDDPPGEGRAAA